MATLYDMLADAKNGEAIAMMGREFGLTAQQTQAAGRRFSLPSPPASNGRRRHLKVLPICSA